ncbi:hypothetical protein C8R46DRAFT_1099751 [Mycena filopes]|nr:hypothetical protein C8R46DRAFT_1099751 [Mycena filopes]
MEDGEPRVDILQDWLDAFSQYNREWEVVWAPQNEKDKRLWVRVQDVFKDDRKDKTEDDKVISSIRKVIETSIGLTTDGFRMGLHAIIILQFPAHADFLIRTGVLNVRAIEYRIVRVRQIEVQAAFEIVVGGFKRGYNDESDARAVCDSWFNSIVNSNGESMLVGVRTDDEEPDFVIYSLSSWATTAYVLSEEMSSNFARQLGSVYGLTTPTLLYAHNSRAVYRKDVGAIIADGAKQVDAGFVALTKRMDKFEREARERDVVNKTQMKHLSDSVTSLTAATALISSQQQDLSRGMYIMGKEMDYTNRLTRLDIDLSLARRTMANPIDDNEKDEAKKEIRDLNAQRIVLKKELDALRGDPILAIAPGPVVSPPPAPAPVAAANIGPSSPRKRPRTSTDGPDPNNSEDDVAQQVLGADVDVSMQPVPESTAS